MHVVKKDQNPGEDRSDAPIFYGGKVTGQAIIGGGTSKNFNFNKVTFAAGAKNHFHTHTSDQILFVTDGRGYVATESEKIEIADGDAAFIPAGEKHLRRLEDYRSIFADAESVSLERRGDGVIVLSYPGAVASKITKSLNERLDAWQSVVDIQGS